MSFDGSFDQIQVHDLINRDLNISICLAVWVVMAIMVIAGSYNIARFG